ncbi:MAG: hypothetical protein PPP58_00835 [Natronomonas sp.]
MNKHFEDTRYYLKRAGETAKAGVSEELEPIEAKVKELTDRDEGEAEPEPSRFDGVREDLERLGKKAEGETREAIEKAKGKLDSYRDEKKDTAE